VPVATVGHLVAMKALSVSPKPDAGIVVDLLFASSG
jgi:hypothetical protein